MGNFKLGMFGRIVLAILGGVALGFAFMHLGAMGDGAMRVFKTFNVLFAQVLKFIVPLLILGLVTPAIADAGKEAGKLLLTVMVASYLSTCAASIFAYFTAGELLPLYVAKGAGAAGGNREGEGGRVELGGLPEAGEEAFAGVASQEEGTFGVAQEEDRLAAGGEGLLGGGAGEVELRALGSGAAGGAEGAGGAVGAVGRTEEGAELHHRLVEVGGEAGGFDEGGEPGGEGAAGRLGGEVVGQGIVAGEDADNIAIDDGDGFAEADAGDGGGGVGADAGQFGEFGGGGGEGAGVVSNEEAGGLAEVAHARVVAQALPGFEEGVVFGGGEGGDGGEGGEEAGEVGPDGLDLGLLEHNFADPDGVGIRVAAPGHFALVGAIPGEERGKALGEDEGGRGRGHFAKRARLHR